MSTPAVDISSWGTPGTPPDASLGDCVTLDDVRAAAHAIAGIVHRTPVLTSRTLDAIVGATVLCKCEQFQRVGAFKFRGAYHAISRLDDAARARGVLTYSSGNHAQGLALAAAMAGVRAVIVMPENAPATKLAATEGYLVGATEGSRVVRYDPAGASREEIGARIAAEEGLAIIPPYDHPHVIAGQGTAAMELIEDAGPIDVLYVCCGGGGLLSGCAVAAKGVLPGVEVVGVEPEAGDDANRSFATGVLHRVDQPDTIADGARTPYLGRHTFPLIMRHVDRMTTVRDVELARVVRFCLVRMKTFIEPSGALALAGAVRDRAALAGKRVGVIVSGGNVDVTAIPGLLAMAEGDPSPDPLKY